MLKKFFISLLVILQLFSPVSVYAISEGVSDYSSDMVDSFNSAVEAYSAEQSSAADPVDATVDSDSDAISGQAAPTTPSDDQIIACNDGVKTSIQWEPGQFASYYNVWRTSATQTSQNGLLGTYYDAIDLTQPVFSRVDPVIDFNWGDGSPDSNNPKRVNPEAFSIRWSGKIKTPLKPSGAPALVTFTFTGTYEDSLGLWIDDERIINDLSSNPTSPKTSSGAIKLEWDKIYNIRLDYKNNTGNASIKLEWQANALDSENNLVFPGYWPPGSTQAAPRQLIPTSYLYPSNSNNVKPKLVSTDIPRPNHPVIFGLNDTPGLYTEYYDGINPSDAKALVLKRAEANINTTTLTVANPPDQVVNGASFSTGWLGKLKTKTQGTYTFKVNSRGGVKLWVKDFRSATKLIDAGNSASVRDLTSIPITLEANTLYDFKMTRTFDSGGNGAADPNIKLYWTPPGEAEQIVSSGYFYRMIDPKYEANAYAQFYDNTLYKGTALVTRLDNQINFLLPPSEISTGENYSVIWTGFIKLPVNSVYKFHTETKDDVKFTINNTNVLSLVNQTSVQRKPSSSISLKGGVYYPFKLEHTHTTGDQTMRLYYEDVTNSSGNQTLIPASMFFHSNILPLGTIQDPGLRVRLYDNKKLSANTISRVEDSINSTSWLGSPSSFVNGDTFSIRWSGRLKAPLTTSYNFTVDYNDGFRMNVDDLNNRFMTDWNDNTTNKSRSNLKSLTQGKSYDFRLDYYEKLNPFIIKLTTPGSTVSYTHNNILDEPISFVDTSAPAAGGPYWYQISVTGSGGTVYSDWFFQDTNCDPTPRIDKLRVNQGGLAPQGGFTGATGVSGNLYDSAKTSIEMNGAYWRNPMRPVLTTISPTTAGTEYYVGFYDKGSYCPSSGKSAEITIKAEFLSEVQCRLKADPKIGFLLGFRKAEGVNPCTAPLTPTTACNADQWYVWDPNSGASGAWKLLDLTFSTNICPSGQASCTGEGILYKVVRTNQPAEWEINFNPIFTSKNMFTGALIRSGVYSDFDGEMIVSP